MFLKPWSIIIIKSANNILTDEQLKLTTLNLEEKKLKIKNTDFRKNINSLNFDIQMKIKIKLTKIF